MALHPMHAVAWLSLILVVTASPANAAESAPHPLINQVWDTRAAQPASLTRIEQRLQNARLALLGEVHDNSIHHRMRRDLVAALLKNGHRPAIAMEQFDREQQPAIDRSLAEAPRDAEKLRSAGGFNDRGWNWPDYAPIIRLALDNGLPLLAANLSRDQAFRVATSSAESVLGEQSVRSLGLDKPLPPVAQRKLERVIDEGHCGKAPGRILPGMVAAQRARDAVMAEIIGRHAGNGVVLIAGNGHVRRDFGVPLYLQTDAAPGSVVVVGFVEVQEDLQKPADYYDAASPEYDFIVFTARTAREDPCATLQFKPR